MQVQTIQIKMKQKNKNGQWLRYAARVDLKNSRAKADVSSVSPSSLQTSLFDEDLTLETLNNNSRPMKSYKLWQTSMCIQKDLLNHSNVLSTDRVKQYFVSIGFGRFPFQLHFSLPYRYNGKVAWFFWFCKKTESKLS